MKEIGDCLGVSLSRISQRVSAIKEKMQQVNTEKPLFVDWITL